MLLCLTCTPRRRRSHFPSHTGEMTQRHTPHPVKTRPWAAAAPLGGGGRAPCSCGRSDVDGDRGHQGGEVPLRSQTNVVSLAVAAGRDPFGESSLTTRRRSRGAGAPSVAAGLHVCGL